MQLAIARAAAGVFLICSAPAIAQLHLLPYRPVDAAYSFDLDRPILVSANPDALHVWNVDTNLEELTVPLPLPPTRVAVSSAGPRAAVGHASAVSYIDIAAAAPPVLFRIDGDVLDIAISDGRIYALASRKNEKIQYVIDISSGKVAALPEGVGNPGQPGRSLGAPTVPLAYSSLRRETAAVSGTDPSTQSEVHFLASDGATRIGSLNLPPFAVRGRMVPGLGRYLFYDNSGQRLIVVEQAHPEAGLSSNDYGIAALPLVHSSAGPSAPFKDATPSATAAITPLSYVVTDAAYSRSLDRIITVSPNPHQLRVYDPVTNTETRTVVLPASPTSVAVSPDGNFAAVGYNGRVSRIDLRDGTIQTIPVPEIVLGVALSATRLYAANGTLVRSIDFAATPATSTTTDGWAVRLAFSTDGTALFGAPPQGIAPERFRLVNGNAVFERRASASASCDNVWPAAAGDRLFTACGEHVRLSTDPLQDLAPLGRFYAEPVRHLVHAPARQSLYIVSGLPGFESEVRRLSDTDYSLQARILIPTLQGESASEGRYLFANAAGSRMFVIANLGAIQLGRFGVYSFDLTAEPACQYSVAPSLVTVGGDGNGEAFVSTTAGCRWEVRTPPGGRFTSHSFGIGSGPLQISASPNRGTTTLTGSLTVEGQTISIQQPPLADCIPFTPMILGTPRLEFGQNGGSQTLFFTMAPGCRWRASAADTQIVTVAPESGFGNGTITITVAPNTGLARTRAVTVAGLSTASSNSLLTVTVVQAASGAGCTYEVNPTMPIAPPFGGTVDVNIITGPGCAWTVAAPNAQPWVTFSPASGTGSGKVTFTATPSPSPDLPRATGFTIGGQNLTLFQYWNPPPASCRYDIAATLVRVAARGAEGTVSLTEVGGCGAFQIVSTPPWFQIYPLQGTTPANVRYTIFPNFSRSRRVGLIKYANGYETLLTQEAATAGADERLVGHLYFAYMGRYPSDAETAFHINEGLRKGLSRTDLVMNFFNAIEFNAGGRFVAGLYVGLLNRDAEFGGWLFQRNALANNVVSDTGIVSNFLNSAEWKLAFGSPTDAEFVRILYRYVLLRAPAPAEVDFHLGTLQRGTTRTQMAANFLNVPEFRAGSGARLTAFLLYACLLGREPTRAEFTTAIAALNGGTPFRTLVDQVLASPEFSALIN